ncbi:unnamed protein product [Gordionus sp. m RMFG-2023]
MWIANNIFEVRSSEDEERLVKDLFRSYNKLIRPVMNKTDHMIVKFGMALIQLINVNELEQVLKTNVWLRLIWYDYQLIWDPSDYGNIKNIRISYHKIWTPDIVLFNNADGKYEVSTKCNLVLHHDGQVLWVPPSIYKSTCIMDVRYFPFDQQFCDMKFGSWTFNGDEVGLAFYDDKDYVDLNDYSISGTWDIINVQGSLNVRNRSLGRERPTKTDITFHLHIRRKSLFYTVNLLAPCIMMSFMSVMVFYLPPDGNEKITLGISILLAIVLFQLVVAKILPPTSVCIPLISIYLLFTFIVNLICVLFTLIIVNWNFREGSIQPIPSFIRSLFVECLPKYVGMKRPTMLRPSQSKNLLKSLSSSRFNAATSISQENIIDEGDIKGCCKKFSLTFWWPGRRKSAKRSYAKEIIKPYSPSMPSTLPQIKKGIKSESQITIYDKFERSHSSNICSSSVEADRNYLNYALVHDERPTNQKLQMMRASRQQREMVYHDKNNCSNKSYINTQDGITPSTHSVVSFKERCVISQNDPSANFRIQLTHTLRKSETNIKQAKDNIYPPPKFTPTKLKADSQKNIFRGSDKNLRSFKYDEGGIIDDDYLIKLQMTRKREKEREMLSAQNIGNRYLQGQFDAAIPMREGNAPGEPVQPTRRRKKDMVLKSSTESAEDSLYHQQNKEIKRQKISFDISTNDSNSTSSNSNKIEHKEKGKYGDRKDQSHSRALDCELRERMIQSVAKNVTFIANHIRKEDESAIEKEDWKYIAIVIDRLLLYIFVIVSLAGTIGIIISAPHIFEFVDQAERIQFLTGKRAE